MSLVTQNFIPGLPQLPYRYGVGHYEGVVAHATDNYGDTKEAERNFEASHWNDAFVHFFVDHAGILQVANTDFKAWGAGKYANERFVHVELCQTYDKQKFEAGYANYCWILGNLLAKKKIGVSRRGTFWTHNDVTQYLGGTFHTDPDQYLLSHGVSINKLVDDVTWWYKYFLEHGC